MIHHLTMLNISYSPDARKPDAGETSRRFMVASFDSSRAVRFDLREGKVALADREPQVLLPLEELLAFAAGERTIRTLARGLGRGAMLRAAARLADPEVPPSSSEGPSETLRAASLPTVVEQLGGEVALLGLGSLRAETWGEALVIVLDPCSLDARGDELVEGMIEGALALATAQEVHALVVDRRPGAVRVVVAHGEAIGRLRPLVLAGEPFAEVLRALHGERPT
jgi:hypothetical protein